MFGLSLNTHSMVNPRVGSFPSSPKKIRQTFNCSLKNEEKKHEKTNPVSKSTSHAFPAFSLPPGHSFTTRRRPTCRWMSLWSIPTRRTSAHNAVPHALPAKPLGGARWEIHMELGIVTWKVRSHKINQNHPMFHSSHDEFDQCICSLNRRKTGQFAVGVSLINWWMVDFRRCKWLVTPWSKATWQWNALNVRISCDYSNVVGQYIYIGFGEMGDVDFVAARGHKVHKFNQI